VAKRGSRSGARVIPHAGDEASDGPTEPADPAALDLGDDGAPDAEAEPQTAEDDAVDIGQVDIGQVDIGPADIDDAGIIPVVAAAEADLQQARSPRRRLRRRLLRAFVVGQTAALVILLASLRLFIYPHLDEPRNADAIVVLGGLGDRIERGLQLYYAGYSSELWISVPQWRNGDYPYVWPCTQEMTDFGERCFDPRPKTTQGEARSIAQLAEQEGWDSIIVVTSVDQTTRARMVIERCWDGEVLMLDASNRSNRFFKLAYEWGAMLKALTIKRGC
jgi:hypothetical protein